VKAAEVSVVAVTAVVAMATALGGAFDPGPRVVVGVLLAAVLAASSFSLRARPAPEEWALIAFLGWGVISAVAANAYPLAAREVLTTWVVAGCLWIAARRVGERSAELALTVLLGTAVIVALAVGLEALGAGRIRVGGVLENPNLTVALLVVAAPALLAVKGVVGRRWRVLAAVCLGAGVILTGSRAGLLALLAACAVTLPRGRLRALGITIGAIAAAGVLVWRFVSQPDILAWFRPTIWAAVLQLWAQHPAAGVGPGGLADAAGAVRLLHADHVGHHQFLIAYAESSALGLLVQTGMVGVLIFGVAAVLWVGRGRAREALRSMPLRASLVAAFVMTLFHDLLTADVVLWWWALLFGLLGGPIEADVRAQTSPASWGTRAIRSAVVSYVVLWGMVQPAWARWLWRADQAGVMRVDRTMRAEPWFDRPLTWRARELFDERRWTWREAAEALARSRRAIRIHPGSARSWLDLALVETRVVTDFGPWPDSVEGARAAFERSHQLEPHLPWSWLEHARLERTLGNPEEARRLARRALLEEPHTVRAWLFLARLEIEAGRMNEARQALDRARASIDLRLIPGLNDYERELLAAPAWQLRELEDQLR
jgi:O-antigen ligase